MKDKLIRKWDLLRKDLSTAKGIFAFGCSAVFATVFIAATFTGLLFFLASYGLAQAPANELVQLKSLTVAQLMPVFEPALREYLRDVIFVSPVMAILCEISRSIRHQERLLVAA